MLSFGRAADRLSLQHRCDLAQRSVNPVLQAVDLAAAGQLNQVHAACVAGFEPHCRSGGDIEPEPPPGLAVEFQGIIDFGKVVVGSDLDGPVPAIGNVHDPDFGAFVAHDLFGTEDVFTGFHRLSSSQRIGLWTVTSLVPSGNVASTWTSAIMSATPSMTSSLVRTVVP